MKMTPIMFSVLKNHREEEKLSSLSHHAEVNYDAIHSRAENSFCHVFFSWFRLS